MPGRTGSHSSAIAEYPVRTGLTETNLAPFLFSLSSPILIGLDAWSSATPQRMKYFARSQSGAPNSQNEYPIEYKPAAAMFTEQNPPCAAQFGVPNCWAQRPVNACIWSRPVKNASFLGSVARMRASRLVSMSSAVSHETGTNSPAPRSEPGLRISGPRSLAAECCFMIPADPLAHSTPWLTGWFAVPWMKRRRPSSSVTLMPHRQAHM